MPAGPIGSTRWRRYSCSLISYTNFMPRKYGEAKISVPVNLQKRVADMAKANKTSPARLIAKPH